MTPLTCPRCAHIDQVQSVATVYTAGARIGLGIGGRIELSQLAVVLAPPTAPYRPRRMPSVGEFVLFVVVGVPGLSVVWYAIAARQAPSLGARVFAVALGLGLFMVPMAVLWFGQRRRRRRWGGYQSYQRIWPEIGRAWWEAVVCLRCHIAFYPVGVLPNVPAARQMIPLPEFRGAVLAIAAQSTDLMEISASTGRDRVAPAASAASGGAMWSGDVKPSPDELPEWFSAIPPDL